MFLGKITWRLDIILLNLMLHEILMVYIEQIRILHEKILNLINLHWFHNDTSEKNKITKMFIQTYLD